MTDTTQATAACDRPRSASESVLDWLLATGRIGAGRADDWREVEASEGAPVLMQICGPFKADDRTAQMNRAALRTIDPLVTDRGHTAQDAVRRPITAAGRNPLVEEARATGRSGVGPAPSLFAGGDLPAFTASGIDPKLLLQVPWQARHPIAGALSTAQAYAILEHCSGPDGADAAALNYINHPGNLEYAERVRSWQISRPMTEAEYNQTFADTRDAIVRKREETNQHWARDEAPKRARAAAVGQLTRDRQASETAQRQRDEAALDARLSRNRWPGA